jgi:hypothetical protein
VAISFGRSSYDRIAQQAIDLITSGGASVLSADITMRHFAGARLRGAHPFTRR